MRTNIVIDDKLMQDTLKATGLRTKREVVELGLRTLLRLRQQEQIKRFRGKLHWQGDLEAMRLDK
ncbi:MAG: type II toxin-antitoxin system VapB family antitoxin [Frankiaceae bacterium]|jgi:Arc/MetJ family transcription regulator|nr:type II toxin-antitoxin system VapB family antitoxin [Arenimonas sp.]